MKTIMITGASRGLGLAVAEQLAQGGHRILLCSRDATRGQQALAQMSRRTQHGQVSVHALDPGSRLSVQRFAQELVESGSAVDVLIHNAGVLQPAPSRRITSDGLEETLAVNVLGPFLLTKLLLPALERAGSARIVSIASRLHIPGSRGPGPRFDFNDPGLVRAYDPDRAYANSKLALIWFTYELQRRLGARSITANALCPGFVPTTAAANATGVQRWLLQHLLPRMPFARSVAQAAAGIVWAAMDPALEGVGGKFFDNQAAVPSSAESYDPAKAAQFWALACRLTDSADWP